MDLPVSFEDILHFYRYLHNHVLIANRQLLLLIDVPQYRNIHNNFPFTFFLPWSFPMEISQHDMKSVHNILESHRIETMAVEISQNQFSICQEANRQVCNVYAPLQLLANPPFCITVLYVKNADNISTRCSLQVRKTQSITIPSSIA